MIILILLQHIIISFIVSVILFMGLIVLPILCMFLLKWLVYYFKKNETK